MKEIIAIILCSMLLTQNVYAMPVNTMPAENIADAEKEMEAERKTEAANGEESGSNTTEANDNTESKQMTERTAVETVTDEILAEEDVKTGEEAKAVEGNTAAAIEVSAPSAILMEPSMGTVIFEKNADTARPPASVTKVMTMLLIFDALESGKIHLEDEVTTSEFAASMGGSQVFLEPGETQTVDTMLKCISVASANDACVAFNNSRQFGVTGIM